MARFARGLDDAAALMFELPCEFDDQDGVFARQSRKHE